MEPPTKKLSQIYCWPNYEHPRALAYGFYDKAIARLSEFPLAGDFAITLCYNGEDFIVHIFADMLTADDVSVKTHDTIDTFLRDSGCPKEQFIEGAYFIPDLTIDNVYKNLAAARVRVVRGVKRKNGQIHKEPKPEIAFTVGYWMVALIVLGLVCWGVYWLLSRLLF